MKFKLNKLALALPMSIMALGAVAGKSPDDIPTIEISKAEQNATIKANNAKLQNRYFVLLEDEPVALYQGGIKGFKATNIAASKGSNATANGKLNIASSASVVYRDYLALKQNDTSLKINKALGRTVTVNNSFKIALNSLVVDLEPNEVLALRKMPGILAVEKEEMQQLLTDVGPQHVGAPAIWDNADVEGSKGEGLIVGVMDTGIASYQKNVYTWTGAAGFDSIDFNPSFADVGADEYDHTNPNGDGVYFGDCIDSPHWCNDKVIGVVSYEGLTSVSGISSYDMRFNTGQDTQGHGTHVTSTIAGNLVEDVSYPTVHPSMEYSYKHKYYTSEMKVSMSGVAPHANIISYQTCNVYGCYPSAAIASVEHAIANNVDVLNYSVGGGARSPWMTSDALAFLSAREAGIHIAVAAGNDGHAGEKTIGSPGNSPWVTTVAALSHSRDFTDEKTTTFTGGATELADLIGKGATSGVGLDAPLTVAYAGDVEVSAYVELAGGVGFCSKNSLPAYYNADSVEGKVVICRRGGNDPADGLPLSRLSKGAEALRVKAAGMIFINSEDEFNNVVNDPHVLPTVHLNKSDGEVLLAWLAEGEGHQVSFTDSELVLNDEKADITATFTSRGPDYYTGDYLVPDVGAPGVDILASGLGTSMHSGALAAAGQINGNTRFMSGTSMATPHIAGMYLLMKAARPNWTPAEAQSALMTTAFTDVTEDDDYDGVKNRADMHRTGSGSARVNLAIEAGLVLNETRAGYLAADPYAQESGMADSIEGWHGQPHQMNMPSLSKGECLIDCTWTRTLKATKDGSWNVSFEYYNEGFTVTADQTSFTLAEGEEAVINFTAEALQGLADEWVNGRVILTPDDNTIPVQTMPITVNFIAGFAPDITEISAKRSNDSAPVVGIVTIGTDELQLSKSGIAKAEIHDFELMRDATNNVIYDYKVENNPTLKLIPLNVQADTKRLVVDVIETSSPDVDIYVGIDADLDGKLSHSEMQLIRYMSANADSDELLDILDPIQDTYWILVHNWAEGPAALEEHQMVCEEGQQADEGMECADAPVMDSVKLSVTKVTYDDDSMSIAVPTSVAPREVVDTRIQWQQAMNEGDTYHGVFWLGTTAELNRNIGAVRVNMTRGEDDVTISEPIVNNDKITFAVRVSGNNSGESRDYGFNMSLMSGITVDILLKDDVVAGASMQMSADDFAYNVADNNLSWSHTQVNGADALEFNIVLDASNVEGLIDATPVVDATVSSSDNAEMKSTEPLFFAGRPTASVSSSVDTVQISESVTLIATVVDAVIENPVMTYLWTQISGPAVTLSGSAESVRFIAPEVVNNEMVKFELVTSNGMKSSFPMEVMVEITPMPVVETEPVVESVLGCTYTDATNFNATATEDDGSCEYPAAPAPTPAPVVEEESKSSGGSTSLGFIALGLLGLIRRKK